MTRLARATISLALPLAGLAAGCSDPETPPVAGPLPVQVHPAGWIEPGVESHVAFLRHHGHDLGACRGCHGADYERLEIENTCRSCHQDPGGPEACNVCHGFIDGDASAPLDVAPPPGLHGETDPQLRSVGAHRRHLALDPGRSLEETCGECHRVPAEVDAPGHIDSAPGAEVMFRGPLGNLATEGGARVPASSYRPATGTCSNTYCHGNWALLKSRTTYEFIFSEDKMEGRPASPAWTDVETVTCGSCHDIPPVGHDPFEITDCVDCHERVIDGTGAIIDEALHVNGQVNVFGLQYPMF